MTPNEYNKKYSGLFRQAIADTRFVVVEKRDNHRTDMDPKKCPWTLNVVYNTTPFADNSQGGLIAHQMLAGGTMTFEHAEFLLYSLYTCFDMPVYPLSKCSAGVRRYITSNIAPLEWHKLLEDRDPATMAKYQIFCFDTPSVPTDDEEEAGFLAASKAL